MVVLWVCLGMFDLVCLFTFGVLDCCCFVSLVCLFCVSFLFPSLGAWFRFPVVLITCFVFVVDVVEFVCLVFDWLVVLRFVWLCGWI